MRLFFSLFFGVIVLYVFMVVSHESGHYVVTRYEGYNNARIHFTHTDTGKNEVLEKYKAFLTLHRNDQFSPDSKEIKEYQALRKQVDEMEHNLEANNYYFGKGSLSIYLAGPFTNMLVALIGSVLLMMSLKDFGGRQKLTTKQWLIVFATVIWFKPVYETLGVFLQKIIFGWFYPTDEYKASILLGLSPWTINIIESTIGAAFLAFLFKKIPRSQRRPFAMAVIIGGIAGSALWHFCGPVILP